MNQKAIKRLSQELHRRKLDALLITSPINVTYLSGFKGEGQILITPTKRALLVDFRYKVEATRYERFFQIHERLSFSPLEESLKPIIKRWRLKRLGFEAGNLSYDFYHRLNRTLKRVKLIPVTNLIEHLRAIKDAREIRLLRKAASCALRSFAYARRIIRPRKREEEIAEEIRHFMRKQGAEDCAFDIIVASGKRSCLPHACSSRKLIRRGEAVLVDLGCRLSGYNSDLTRMVFLGKIGGKIKHLYQTVTKAQQLAIKAVRAGEKIARIDHIARHCIAEEGLRPFFGHALGHGIGREVHEYPSISPRSQQTLQEGMVITLEPGVYLPGWGGIRIEDMVLVKRNGCEVLTK